MPHQKLQPLALAVREHLRTALAEHLLNGNPPPSALPVLGHIYEISAAALGYKSYAAYSASTSEPASWVGVRYVVLDSVLLAAKAKALGFSDHGVALLGEALVAAVATAMPGAEAHLSEQDLLYSVQQDVEQEIFDSAEFASGQAETNTSGLAEFELEVNDNDDFSEPATTWAMDIVGQANLDQDIDKPFAGDVLDISASLQFEKLGRRLLGTFTVDDIGASVNDDWYQPSEDLT